LDGGALVPLEALAREVPRERTWLPRSRHCGRARHRHTIRREPRHSVATVRSSGATTATTASRRRTRASVCARCSIGWPQPVPRLSATYTRCSTGSRRGRD